MIINDVRGLRGFGDEWWKIFTAPIDAVATGWATSNAANAATAQAQAMSNAALAQSQVQLAHESAEKTEAIVKYAAIGGAAIIGLAVVAKIVLSRRAKAAPVAGYRRSRRRR